jgi:hypothetical protein
LVKICFILLLFMKNNKSSTFSFFKNFFGSK